MRVILKVTQVALSNILLCAVPVVTVPSLFSHVKKCTKFFALS